jgi:TRAP transporter TAXI family solute receptor
MLPKLKLENVVLKNVVPFLLAATLAIPLICSSPAATCAEERFVILGGGDVRGVYFPAGLAMAKLLNAKRAQYGIRATGEATPGSTFNVKALIAGYLEFGLAQSDEQYEPFSGTGEWKPRGPQKDLRAVFSLHPEAVTLVAADDKGIESVADLKGKRVSTGNPGWSRHPITMDVLRAAGLDPSDDVDLDRVMGSDAPAMLEDDRIDAFFLHGRTSKRHRPNGVIDGAQGPNHSRCWPGD